MIEHRAIYYCLISLHAPVFGFVKAHDTYFPFDANTTCFLQTSMKGTI